MTTIVTHDFSETVRIPLTDLVSLKDTTFKLPTHAMRDLEPAHVLELSKTDSSTWPPIRVCDTEDGYVITDGYHREAALTMQSKIAFLQLEDATPSAQRKAIDAELDEETQKRLEQYLDNVLISAEIGTYKNEKDVAKVALTANLTHGLAPKGKTRTAIAVELYILTRGEEPEPTQAEIARLVGISRATLNGELKKLEKEAEEAAKLSEAGEEGESAAVETVDMSRDKAEKLVEKFLKSLEKVAGENPEAYNHALELLLPHVVVAIADTYSDKDESTYVDAVRKNIELSEAVPQNAYDSVTKFAAMLTKASKKFKRSAE